MDNKKIICECCQKEIKEDYYSDGSVDICEDCAEDELTYITDGFWTYQDCSGNGEFFLDDDLSDVPQFFLEKFKKEEDKKND